MRSPAAELARIKVTYGQWSIIMSGDRRDGTDRYTASCNGSTIHADTLGELERRLAVADKGWHGE